MKLMHRCNHAEMWNDYESIYPSTHIKFSHGDYTKNFYMRIAIFNCNTNDKIISVAVAYKYTNSNNSENID